MPMFSAFYTLFIVVFIVVLGTIVITMVRSLLQWNKNNNSPKLTVDANIVAKRTHVSRRGGYGQYHASYHLLCDLSGGKRGPDGNECQRTGIRYADRGRPREANISRNPVSGFSAQLSGAGG